MELEKINAVLYPTAVFLLFIDHTFIDIALF